MNFPRNEFEAWALPHFSGGDAEAVIALMELDSKGDYRSDEMRAARDAWQQLAGHRDALAAQLDKPRIKIISDLAKSGIDPEDITTSLARRDAEKQAEALDGAVRTAETKRQTSVARWLKNMANTCRCQAEGGSS